MSYPFAPMPSLGQFIQRAKSQFGAQLKRTKVIMGPRGPMSGQYLERVVGDVRKRMVVPKHLKPDDILRPNLVRSFCKRLGIDPVNFGFTLSDDW